MLSIRENMSSWISNLTSKIGILGVLLNIVDIVLLSLLFYICAKFLASIMRKRSGRLLVGIFAVILLVIVSYLLNLRATFFVLETVMQFGVIALVVIFQPEIRKLLENVGYVGKNFRVKSLFISKNEKIIIIDSICRAVKSMSNNHVGALIVFQKDKEINAYDEMKAVSLNSDISRELIENIFFKNSPLHDGAVVINDFRISKARVLFDEISNNPTLALDLGSRHKAAVGATEGDSDCTAVVVSEETGRISYAKDGELKHNISHDELYKILISELITSNQNEDKSEDKKEKNDVTR
ncbi:MAG: diadenylate cyclase [Clostridia bacterium]|nr:diadenylate cyclase [Clostridia bacterium]